MLDGRPNFLIFLTDDQGYGDLSCMGATDFRTPNLDRMAAEGVRFTDWYSNSPVCSPSRAALLTGRYPGNAGIRGVLRGGRETAGLRQSATTIATMLGSAGYETAMAGKWHLGLTEHARPSHHGFNDSFGFLAGTIDYYSHIFFYSANQPPSPNPTHDLWENDEEVWHNGEYFTELITDKAIEYMRKMHASGNPFLLYVPFNAPHYPMHAPEEYVDRFPDLPWDRQMMAAMISSVDDAIGKILNEVDRLGVGDNTMSVFMSDNGPSRESRNWLDGTLDPYYGGTVGRLKGHKGSLYEGGIRLPGIIRWPERVDGGVVTDQPGVAMDIVPTILEAAGVDSSAHEIDGTSLMTLLADKAETPERTIFWEWGEQTAVRRGKWKLVLEGRLVEHESPVAAVHLADLDSDPSESRNLADSEPEVTAELKYLAEEWRATVEKRWLDEFGAPDVAQRRMPD
ncbi:MAG TPA: sulfatase-like hydrolase/transferase [Dehalococcoidia bacterium]|jgi:arylsulfatase A-like enzyme|nr:sulfatase [Chloroflexota bacterium]MDP5876094.1 sulfatase-like hydrolase/transferase [Dehalococcoidia bacterium]MDP6273823.1 sulfatase-like hydrolase/transferase [Dehalococcoidia bacterium]MDP7160606.1 sulfatase-like hydrolase/transferase [Dehalococcoidia bacterium]MDP7213653.1 sulfatase-like hydrolase/transferase [Dehalococcoidia bacterium]|tara:strand:+ start:4936 stop:6297 length:1362 start_codon:yes stop_codon:yes gene_type:complete